MNIVNHLGMLQHQHSIETQLTDISSKQSTVSADSCLPKSQVSLSDRKRSRNDLNATRVMQNLAKRRDLFMQCNFLDSKKKHLTTNKSFDSS